MSERTTQRLLTVVAFAVLAGLVALLSLVAPAATLPGDFSDTKFASSPLPTALAFTPDGRMLVTSKTGELYVYGKEGDRLANPALSLPVCSNSERGLLGVAIDPDFATNKHFYVYYTNRRADCPDKEPSKDSNPYNRVSRFTLNDDNTVDKPGEKVLIDGIPSPNGNHNAGDLHFGNDGKLYVSVGDGACDYFETSKCQYENDVSRDEHILLGKILRINSDGTIPEDNPYTGPNSERCSPVGPAAPGEIARTEEGKNCKETFVKGFRNPFRFAVDYDAVGTRLFVNNVGGQRWEEVEEARFGADNGNDYGWNICEGRHDNPYRGGQANCDGATHTGPVHEYSHSTGCESITAGTFVPDSSNWPARYKDDYLYGDFVCGKIFSLSKKPDSPGYAREMLIGGLGIRSAVAMAFGPYKDTEALYYATFDGNGGSIRRVAYTPGAQPPVADVKTRGQNYGDADPNTPGFQINFDASGTKDPNGDANLSYRWDFDGNGSVDKTTDAPQTSHTYAERGKYAVALTVADGTGAISEPAKINVFPGDAPPEPAITQAPDAFRVGAAHTATGGATDPDDDTVALSWEVAQVHDENHEHPLKQGVSGGSVDFNGPPSEGLFSMDPARNYVVVRLTATDPLGLSKTVERVVRPRSVDLTFATRPSGLKITVFGEVIRGQRTVTAWVGDDLRVVAPRQRDRDGHTWAFKSWSDGGTATHVVDAPESPETYTATFGRASR
jgi:glucose/arabinose dehydrogenase/PKD repeat protein